MKDMRAIAPGLRALATGAFRDDPAWRHAARRGVAAVVLRRIGRCSAREPDNFLPRAAPQPRARELWNGNDQRRPKSRPPRRPRRRRRTARFSTCPMRRLRSSSRPPRRAASSRSTQLNAVLPSEEVSPDQIEDTMSMLSDMGITVVESEEPEEAPPRRTARTPRRRSRPAARSPRRACLPSPRRAPSRPSAPTIPCACTCATWARWSCSRARARSPSPSASRPAARP